MINLLTSDIYNSIKLIRNGLTKDLYESYYRPLHLFTNENITGIIDNINLENASILLPCASSDQLFNFLLHNPKKITTYDINKLTTYLFELKKAAILDLNRCEFLDFFYPRENILTNSFLNFETYQKIRKNLSREGKIFWDSILQAYNPKYLKKSSLFLNTIYSKKTIQDINPYLDNINYDKLKEILKDFSLDFINCNIKDLHSLLNEKYDFIYLSNIADYLDTRKVLKELASIVENLKVFLNINGMIGVVYLYNYLDEFFYDTAYPLYNDKLRNDFFSGSEYSYIEFPNALFQHQKKKKELIRKRDYDSILTYHQK